MIPFRFGPDRSDLFAVFHQGARANRRSVAVLLCNPYGQEAVRTHRMYRVLAERLEKKGYDVLRFDYFATGESAGDDEQGDLERWRDDVHEAHRELRKRSRASRQVWVGARLGATLALLAAAASDDPPDTLVLWDPIVDGKAYLDELDASHARQIRSSFSIVPPGVALARQGEALGFGTHPQFEAQFAALNADRLAQARVRRAMLLAPAEDLGVQALAQALRATAVDTRLVGFGHAFDWVSEEALNTALVPAEALQHLVALVEEASAP